jgi:hypothetical protein
MDHHHQRALAPDHVVDLDPAVFGIAVLKGLGLGIAAHVGSPVEVFPYTVSDPGGVDKRAAPPSGQAGDRP